MTSDAAANERARGRESLMTRLEEWVASFGPGGVRRATGRAVFPSRQMTRVGPVA